jgi:alkaline phosphatase
MTNSIKCLVVLVAAATATFLTASSAAGNDRFSEVKNVILFIGDGMGPQQLELARLMLGSDLPTIDLPIWESGTLDTTSLDGITDSAAGGTALATGYETLNRWVSMTPSPGGPLPGIERETVLERAESLSKASGLVSDLENSDATPAAFGAHVTDRGMGLAITEDLRDQGIEVLLSGGWSESYVLDGLPGVTYVSELADLQPYFDGAPWPTALYGVFHHTQLAYTIDREQEGAIGIQPTLPEMTEAALGVLEQDADGFFLMVEGGAIDWAGHARDAAWTNAEVQEFDEAVGVAVDWTSGRGDTLIVVTADHETGGLKLNQNTDVDAIGAVTASTEWMWGAIKHGASIEDTMADYAGITKLSGRERRLISENKEMGIADVLSARQNVAWGWSGTDEGDHTDVNVPVFASGPGADAFGALDGDDNEEVGILLLEAISH